MVGKEYWPAVPPELQTVDAQLTLELDQLPPIPPDFLSPSQKEVFDLASQDMTIEATGQAREGSSLYVTVRTHRKRGFLKLNDNYMPRVAYRMLDSGLIEYEYDEDFPPQDVYEFTPLGAIVLKGIILRTDTKWLAELTGSSYDVLHKRIPAQVRDFFGVERTASLARRAYEVQLFVPRTPQPVTEAAEPARQAGGRQISFPAYRGKDIRFGRP